MSYRYSNRISNPAILLLIAVIIGLCPAAVARAQMYRWVDANGQLHFSNSPQNIPSEIRNKNNEYEPDTSSITIVNGANNSGDNSTVSQSTELRAEPLQQNSISIPYIAKEGSANRVIINVTFNQQVTVPILVDTGSPGLIISNSLADQLNLFDSEGGRLMVAISGIGGQEMATKTIIDSLTMGEITEKFIPAHIVSDLTSKHYQGLIGMDVLSSYTMTIDPIRQRLVAKLIPSAQDLPAGRNRSWWMSTFREFSFYTEYWNHQEELLRKSDSPYARMSSSELKKIKAFILQQKNTADDLYSQLERYARFNSVPRHWRR